MIPLSSSPLPIRRADAVPATPEHDHGSHRWRGAAYNTRDDDRDELAPSVSYTQSKYFTQPTQIVNRGSLRSPSPPPGLSSSPCFTSPRRPGDIVEVPASSPFQVRSVAPAPPPPPSLPGPFAVMRSRQASATSGLATLMAPAGTAYRPPARAPVPARNVINLSSDSEQDHKRKYADDDSEDEDKTPARGDIKPASFINRQSFTLPDREFLQQIPDAVKRRHTANVHEVLKGTQPIRTCYSVLESRAWNAKAAIKELKQRGIEEANPTEEEVMVKIRKDSVGNPSAGPKDFQTMVQAYSHSSLKNPANNSSENGRQLSHPTTSHSTSFSAHRQLPQNNSSKIENGSREPQQKGSRTKFVKKRDEQRPPPRSVKEILSESESPMERRRAIDLEKVEEAPAKKRKLMRGRPPRNSSPDFINFDSSPVKTIGQPPPASSPVSDKGASQENAISVDSDESEVENEAYQDSDQDDEPRRRKKTVDQLDFDAKVLHFLNNCSAVEIMAVASCKLPDAELITAGKPYKTLAAARKVAKVANRSRRQVSVLVGDAIVDSIADYLRALSTVNEIFRLCETRASKVKKGMHGWCMNAAGELVGGKLAKDQDELHGSPEDIPRDLPISRQPSLMDGHCELKSYQLFGLNWMNLLYQSNFGCILADDMGLGKTCQVIAFMCHIVEAYNENPVGRRPWPNLIVVPPSTFSNWLAEFERFAPDLSVIAYQGSQQDRAEVAHEILTSSEEFHVVLTTYTQISKEDDIEAITKLRTNVAVFDEGHKLKNAKTKVYSDLMKIRPKWRLILTGTPVQNNLMELVSLLTFLDPSLLSKHSEALQTIFNQKATLKDVSNGVILFDDRIQRARAILEPFILQRRKEQVLKSLPRKSYRLVLCDLDEDQRRIYESFQTKFTSSQTAVAPKSNDENNPWIQLRKAAIHSQLFRRHFEMPKVEKMAKTLMANVPQSELHQPNITHLIAELKQSSDFQLHLWCRDYDCIKHLDVPAHSWLNSGKVQALIKLLREFRDNGDRVLIFSKFAKVVEILSECLFSEDIRFNVLMGMTNVDERQGLINEFNEDPSITAFLLTTGAGGTGINLATANKVIIFDQSDNPQDDIQAENRAHRLGQTRPVEIIRLISRGTIEELIFKACQKKVALANQVVLGNKQEAQPELSMEQEVRNMMAANERAGLAATLAKLDEDEATDDIKDKVQGERASSAETVLPTIESNANGGTNDANSKRVTRKDIHDGTVSPIGGSETSWGDNTSASVISTATASPDAEQVVQG